MESDPRFDDLKGPGVLVESSPGFFRCKIKINPFKFVYFKGEAGYDGHASFVVKTYDEFAGRRHPYFERFRATDLAVRALDYFSEEVDLVGLDFRWTRQYGDLPNPSKNFTDYINALPEQPNGIDPQQVMIGAAMQTWTAQRIAIPNGFTELHEVIEEYDYKDKDKLIIVRGAFMQPEGSIYTPTNSTKDS